ncbi:MAG: hypothetical protein ABIR79_19635 [Candidatus Binatia bacterium]
MDEATHVGAARALLLMRILRAGILTVCCAAAVAAWMAGSRTVLALAIVIAAEEMWECSVVVAALRRAALGAPTLPARSFAPSLPRHRS